LLLGEVLPPSPTWRTVLTEWDFAPAAALLCALAAGLYLAGVRRLARRGHRWSPLRTAAFLAGVGTIVVATQSMLETYDDVLFSLHMVQHMLLGMVAPLLLALGAPVTLALQASHRSTQRWLLRLVHSRPLILLTNPIVGWSVMGGTLFAYYFTSLYSFSLRHAWFHDYMHLHFVVAGVLFFWPIIGLDPQRHRLPYPARLGYVLLAVPYHLFFGLALLSATRPLAGAYYASLHRTWGPSLLADQRTGAYIVWAMGDIFGLVAGGIILVQWVAYDERRQRREDRILDAAEAAGSPQLAT
jgi:putative copper resistance protein D